DDITFSSNKNLFYANSELVSEIERIIQDQRFTINYEKVRLQQQGYRQEVTGLVVNEKANVHKRYVKYLRLWLYLWERYGYEKTNEFFLNDYLKDKGYIKNNLPNMVCILGGKLDFLKMVRGEEDLLFIKLNNRYSQLIEQVKSIAIKEKNGLQINFKKAGKHTAKDIGVFLQKLAEEDFEKAIEYFLK
ncbi:MAG TPA: RNA-directed DNA polymerase, partial [Bacteroidia bacterium]|nr:RNA-directed DNA polymerase [Bacteroidia bacterium]